MNVAHIVLSRVRYKDHFDTEIDFIESVHLTEEGANTRCELLRHVLAADEVHSDLALEDKSAGITSREYLVESWGMLP